MTKASPGRGCDLLNIHNMTTCLLRTYKVGFRIWTSVTSGVTLASKYEMVTRAKKEGVFYNNMNKPRGLGHLWTSLFLCPGAVQGHISKGEMVIEPHVMCLTT